MNLFGAKDITLDVIMIYNTFHIPFSFQCSPCQTCWQIVYGDARSGASATVPRGFECDSQALSSPLSSNSVNILCTTGQLSNVGGGGIWCDEAKANLVRVFMFSFCLYHY